MRVDRWWKDGNGQIEGRKERKGRERGTADAMEECRKGRKRKDNCRERKGKKKRWKPLFLSYYFSEVISWLVFFFIFLVCFFFCFVFLFFCTAEDYFLIRRRIKISLILYRQRHELLVITAYTGALLAIRRKYIPIVTLLFSHARLVEKGSTTRKSLLFSWWNSLSNM